MKVYPPKVISSDVPIDRKYKKYRPTFTKIISKGVNEFHGTR